MAAGFPLQGLAAFLNNQIGRTITPQNYARSALMWLLMAVTPVADDLKIGRPNEGGYLLGADVQKINHMPSSGQKGFTQRIQAFKTSNTSVIGGRGTMPTVQNATTASQDIAGQNAAQWNWCANIDTPYLVWNAPLMTAWNNAEQDGGIAMGQLLEEAQAIAREEHIDNVNSRLLYGAPSNQDAEYWDDISGVISALTQNNRYAMVNRNDIPSTSPWNPNYVSTFALDITRIIDYTQVTLGTTIYGTGVQVVLAGSSNFLALKNQALARDKSVRMLSDSAGDQAKLPNLAAVGMRSQVVCCNGVYIMHEPFLDTCYGTDRNGTALYTAQPGYALALNLKTWDFRTHPNASMTATGLTDLSENSEGAKDARQGFIKTWAVLRCLRPQQNVLFAALA